MLTCFQAMTECFHHLCDTLHGCSNQSGRSGLSLITFRQIKHTHEHFELTILTVKTNKSHPPNVTVISLLIVIGCSCFCQKLEFYNSCTGWTRLPTCVLRVPTEYLDNEMVSIPWETFKHFCCQLLLLWSVTKLLKLKGLLKGVWISLLFNYGSSMKQLNTW